MKGVMLTVLRGEKIIVSLRRIVKNIDLVTRLTPNEVGLMSKAMAAETMKTLGLPPRVQVTARKKVEGAGVTWLRLDMPFSATLELGKDSISLIQKIENDRIPERRETAEALKAEVEESIVAGCSLFGVTGHWELEVADIENDECSFIFTCKDLKLSGAENGNQENSDRVENGETGSGDNAPGGGLGHGDRPAREDSFRVQEPTGSDLADKGKIN